MVYGCGFAAQRTVYDWIAGNEHEYVEGVAPSAEDLGAVKALLPEGWTLEATARAEAEPVENALALIKRQLLRVAARLDSDGYIYEDLELFLTGKGNYREDIAKVKPYKGNRLLMEKPVHYKALRRYLVRQWKAQIVHGVEADDIVATISASYQHDPDQVMIVSQDKDLRTVPGLLYNYRRDTYELITAQEALCAFYRQILTGDPTDNIPGCHRCGEKRAEQVLRATMTESQMYATVLEEYQASLLKAGCLYAGREAADVVLEMGRLLHLQRRPGELWVPPLES
jgi:hypothetical protein